MSTRSIDRNEENSKQVSHMSCILRSVSLVRFINFYSKSDIYHNMAGRGMRARAPVSYNDKNPTGMVPAWLKTIQPNVNDPPAEPKRKKKTVKSKKQTAGSPEKENTSDISDVSPTVKSRGTKGASKGGPEAKTSQQKIKENNKGKKKGVAARGRNAGLKIVPIGTCTLLTFGATGGRHAVGE